MSAVANVTSPGSALPPSGPPTIDFEITKEVGYYRLVWRRFAGRKMALVSIGTVIAIVLACFVLPIFLPAPVPHPEEAAYANPSLTHPFGTDEVGRDLLTRTLLGGQISLEVGLFAMLITIIIATGFGAIAGFLGGIFDGFVNIVTNAVLGIPAIVLLIISTGALAQTHVISGQWGVILALGLISWPGTARIVRSVVLSLREKEFIEAARAVGTRPFRILIHHILPNALGPIIVSASFAIVNAILSESALSFLGLGIGQPIPTWGAIIDLGYNAITTHNDFFYALWPGLFILITVMCFNYIGDALRDAFDPRALER